MVSATKKWTVSAIKAMKAKGKIACLTAGDWHTARLLDEAGFPLVLVGDSLAMTMLGYPNTLPVTMPAMLHHAAAVTRGVHSALVVADMPFMSYQVSISQALENAGRFLKEAGVGAVKIEGGAFRVPLIKALIENGIPVLGHIGLTPQSVLAAGGYRVQGRKPAEARSILKDALALEQAGVFAIVLECMPPALAVKITRAVAVPTIGIGAGAGCDGQILVSHDILGLSVFTPKFVKRYADLGGAMQKAFAKFKTEVEQGVFPDPAHGY